MTAPVLVVDDSLTVRMDLSEAFEGAGMAVLACGTLDEARRLLASEAVGLVVLDVNLPDGNGIDLLGELRADTARCSLPVMVLSSEAEVRDRMRALEVGADDYVGKPYDVSYVVSRARQLLAGHDAAPRRSPGAGHRRQRHLPRGDERRPAPGRLPGGHRRDGRGRPARRRPRARWPSSSTGRCRASTAPP
ncbi:MAG: response regulator [Polyangiaceae bacterium]